MSTHLFFNIITAFVNTKIYSISKFFGCLQNTEVHGGVSSNFETDWRQVMRIWWTTHFFKSGFKQCPACDP